MAVRGNTITPSPPLPMNTVTMATPCAMGTLLPVDFYPFYMKGINGKRMLISLLLAGFFGLVCAYGTSTVEIEGFTITLPYLATIFYARLLMGFMIGLAGGVLILKGDMKNAVVRGAVLGVISSIVISFYGGGEIFIAAGIVYGIITDVVATKLQ